MNPPTVSAATTGRCNRRGSSARRDSKSTPADIVAEFVRDVDSRGRTVRRFVITNLGPAMAREVNFEVTAARGSSPENCYGGSHAANPRVSSRSPVHLHGFRLPTDSTVCSGKALVAGPRGRQGNLPDIEHPLKPRALSTTTCRR